ncbi:MAG: chemotaxis protein CheW [Pseudomonadales bacterium]|nr:chemotaxis protein CheW [Pseudomonadales bacterium]
MTDSNQSTAHPFDILYEYQTRCLKNAKNHPIVNEPRAEWSGLGYELGNHNIITPLNEVSEYLNIPNFTRIPRVKNWLTGVTNVRGRLIPILDLNGFLGFEHKTAQSKKRLLVVENSELVCGFAVDSVFGLQTFFADSLHKGAPTDHEKLRPFISGYFEKSGQIWFVLNLKKVLEHDDFFDIAV